jgi:hypothetical protein
MRAKGLQARPINDGDRDRFDRFAADHGGVFDSVAWGDCVSPNLVRIGLFDRGDALRGGFCADVQRRFGLTILRNPPFTRQIGPFFEYRASNAAARLTERRAVVEAMANYLASAHAAVVSLSLSPSVTDTLPFYWRGFKVVPHYTFRLDLTQNLRTLAADMSAERRNDIRKAERDGITTREVDDSHVLRGLVVATFDRQGTSFPREAMDRILSAFSPGGAQSYCIVASDAGRAHAAAYVVHDQETAYYLMGGYSAEQPHHGAGALALNHAIRRAQETGLRVFDFEGSMRPSIERFFRGFGGELVPVFGIHRAWIPIEILLKGKYRNRF